MKRLQKKGTKDVDFSIGDYVMVYDGDRTSKIGQRWRGPAVVRQRLDEGNDFVWVVEFLATGKKSKTQTVHASKLKFFDYAEMVVTPELMLQAEYFAKRKWDVEKLADLRKVGQEYQILVHWSNGEETWEPVAQLMQDVPLLVKEFINHEVPERAKKLVMGLKKLRLWRGNIG